MTTPLHVLPTMDCEPPDDDISAYAREKSGSGPADYDASERSIRGYMDVVSSFGFRPTLFVQPRLAEAQRELFLELEDEGACLGLHLHPYKLDDTYREEVGAYPPSEQRELLRAAVDRWRDAIGRHPRYFRAGLFSANDDTFRLLDELGFDGGSVSSPGRVLPQRASVWAGAEPYPHRAHHGFRQLSGDSEFVDVPMTVDFSSPIEQGHAGQSGYEILYTSAVQAEGGERDYELDSVTRNVLGRLQQDAPDHLAIVSNTHNNMDYADPDHQAVTNLEQVLRTVTDLGDELGMEPERATLETVVDAVRRGKQ